MQEMDEVDLYEAANGDKAMERYLTRLNEEKRRKRAAKANRTRTGKYTEAEIQKTIYGRLEVLGYMVVRINSSTQITEHGTRLSAYRVVNINSTAGHADLVAYKDGRVWMLEVKRPGGKASDSQKRFLECCQRYGVPYAIVTNAEEAIEFIQSGEK